MIISKTPLRVSFVGGGTDLPAFYHQTPGAVVTTAINKYVYIVVNPKFDGRVRVSYSVTESVDHPSELQHELVRAALELLELQSGGIEIVSVADIPSGTGLGSSSSYTVGLLNALHAYKGEVVAAEQLAQEACRVEIEMCGKPIGKQDQYIAAYGGFRHIHFYTNDSVVVERVNAPCATLTEIQKSLLLFFTGETRSATTILAEQQGNVPSRTNALKTMALLPQELCTALRRGNLEVFPRLLHLNWRAKCTLASGITNTQLDDWYERGIQAGAQGGKVAGAGGGGFLLFYAPPAAHDSISAALPELRRVPFAFEPLGSHILYRGLP